MVILMVDVTLETWRQKAQKGQKEVNKKERKKTFSEWHRKTKNNDQRHYQFTRRAVKRFNDSLALGCCCFFFRRNQMKNSHEFVVLFYGVGVNFKKILRTRCALTWFLRGVPLFPTDARDIYI